MADPRPCLTVEAASFASPEHQPGIPFWDQPWIAPDLYNLLFGGQELSHTYLIVDATRRAEVTGIFDLDQLPVPVSCLFQGAAERDFGASAPYLIDLTLPSTGPTPFHRSFFLKHWDRGTGILLRSKAPMSAIRAHFRKFTLVRNSQGEMMFFRFWEPSTLYDYFSLVASYPARAKDLFCLQSGDMVDLIVGHAEVLGRSHIIRPDEQALALAEHMRGLLQLHPAEEQALYRGVLRQYAKRIERRFALESNLSDAAQREALVFDCVCRMRDRGILDLAEIERQLRWELS